MLPTEKKNGNFVLIYSMFFFVCAGACMCSLCWAEFLISPDE